MATGLPTLVGVNCVEHVVNLGGGRVTLLLKDGSTVTGVLRKAPRIVPSPRSPEEHAAAS